MIQLKKIEDFYEYWYNKHDIKGEDLNCLCLYEGILFVSNMHLLPTEDVDWSLHTNCVDGCLYVNPGKKIGKVIPVDELDELYEVGFEKGDFCPLGLDCQFM